jgi:hypothetical protein
MSTIPGLLAILLLAGTAAGAAPNPIHWEVRQGPAKAVKPGARFTVKLAARIDAGWHLYSMKRFTDGPIPTRIWIAEGQSAALSGAVEAPDPLMLQDPNFNMEVEFYAGEAVFLLPLRVRAAATGAQKVTVSTSYQACSDRICLPPRTVTIEVPIEVKK